MPGHTFTPPVPIVARIMWEHDGGGRSRRSRWAGRAGTSTCACQTRATLTAVWLDAPECPPMLGAALLRRFRQPYYQVAAPTATHLL
jgi:hypothetical protein